MCGLCTWRLDEDRAPICWRGGGDMGSTSLSGSSLSEDGVGGFHTVVLAGLTACGIGDRPPWWLVSDPLPDNDRGIYVRFCPGRPRFFFHFFESDINRSFVLFRVMTRAIFPFLGSSSASAISSKWDVSNTGSQCQVIETYRDPNV